MDNTACTYSDPREFAHCGVRYACATCDDDGTIRVERTVGGEGDRIRIDFHDCGDGARIGRREWRRRAAGIWHRVTRPARGPETYALPETAEEFADYDALYAAEQYRRILRAETESRVQSDAAFNAWKQRDLVPHTGGRLRR